MSYLDKLFNQSKILKGEKQSLTRVSEIVNVNHIPLIQQFYSLPKETDVFFIFDKDKILILINTLQLLQDETSVLKLLEFLYKRDSLLSLWINGEINIQESSLREISELCSVKSVHSFLDDIIILFKNGNVSYIPSTENKNTNLAIFCEKNEIDKICVSSSIIITLSIYGTISIYTNNNFISRYTIRERVLDIACTNSSIGLLLDSGKVIAVSDQRISESISSNNVKLISSESNIIAIREDSTFEIYIDYMSTVRIFQTFREYSHQANLITCGKLFTICSTSSNSYRLINIRQDLEIASKDPIADISANGTNFIILFQNGKISVTNILNMKKTTLLNKKFEKISCSDNGFHVGISNGEIFSITDAIKLITYEKTQYNENKRYKKIQDLISEEVVDIFSSGNYNIITTKGSKMFLLYRGERKIL